MLSADLAVIFFKYFISHRPPRCRQRAFYMAHVSVGYVDIHLGSLDVVMPPQIRNPTKVSERCGPNRQECDFSSLD